MDNIIKALLQELRDKHKISNLIDELQEIVGQQKDEDVDPYHSILDYYSIPPDTCEPDKECEDQKKVVFYRDFFYEIIFDASSGDMTYEELDYFLIHWKDIFDEINDLYPLGVGGDINITDVIKDIIKNEILRLK